jgi:hypothetical protein
MSEANILAADVYFFWNTIVATFILALCVSVCGFSKF